MLYARVLSVGGKPTVNEDPLMAVYEFVERSYIRMQAGEVLNHCLDRGNPAPIQSLVEGLVLAGPESLSVLREILAEVNARKTTLLDDCNQILHRFFDRLSSYGISAANQWTMASFSGLNSRMFLSLLKQQGITEEHAQTQCLRLFQETKELLESVTDNIRLLRDIENYLEDWLWGLIYQSCRQRWSEMPLAAKDSQKPM